MSDKNILLAVAKSKTTANRLAKGLSSVDLKRAITNLQSAAVAIQKAESEKAEKARAANLKKLKALMDKMGLSAEDMRGLSSGACEYGRPKKPRPNEKLPKKGTKVAPKYQIKVGKNAQMDRRGWRFGLQSEKGGALEVFNG